MDQSDQEKDSEQDLETFQTSPLPEGYFKCIPSGVESTSGMVPEMMGWDVYNNEAKKVDSELVKDWTASLNFLLVFAAIFAAVLSAFIIESKKLLESDPTSIMVDVLIFYTNNAANGTHSPYHRKEFHPTAEAISINCLLFGSLSFSIVAALGSVLALQWVADYDAAITRGGSSPEDRGKRRQFRYGGVISWRMGGVIAALPLLLHLSVLLFFVGVTQWVSTLNSTVGYVLVAGGATAALFYLSTTLMAVAFPSAPFKTPLSRSMESLFQFPTLLRHLHSQLSSRLRPTPRLNNEIYAQSERSESIIVNSSTKLASQALTWVGGVINISPESHRRPFLLLDCILRLRPAVNWPKVLLSAPWIRILDNMGRKHLDNSSITVTDEDIYEVSILMAVFENELIKAQITPLKYMNKEEGNEALPGDDPQSINGIFLLLHELPPPSAIGMRNVILLSRWRHHGNLEVWDAIIKCYYEEHQFVCANRPTAAEDCLTILVRHFCESIPYLKDNGYWTIDGIIERFANVWPTGHAAFQALRTMVQFFESRVTGEEIRNKPLGIFSNRELYASRVGMVVATDNHWSSVKLCLHYKLLKLLAQTLGPNPKEDQDRYLHEIITMLWSSPTHPDSKSWKEECSSDDVPRAADRQAGNTINDYLGCLNCLVSVLRRLAEDLREMISPPNKFDYPERPFTLNDVERLIMSIHSELKKLGFETSNFNPHMVFSLTPHEDEAATPSYTSLIKFICRGVDFVIQNYDTLKYGEMMNEDYEDQYNRDVQHHTPAGPLVMQATSPSVIEFLSSLPQTEILME